MPKNDRYPLAEAVAGRLRGSEGRNLVAAGVYGSVAMGLDRAHSDVDVLAILRRNRRPPEARVVEGTLVWLLRMTADEARREVTDPSPDIPEILAGWRSLVPLHDPEGLLRRLKRRADRPRRDLFRRSARRALEGSIEDLGKLLNAARAGEAEEAREMAIWFTGGAARALHCLEGRVLASGRRMFIEARDVGRVGDRIAALRYEAHTAEETERLARAIWDDLLARAHRAGVRLPALPDWAGSSRTAHGTF